jgi:hypothetical protein
MGRFTGVLGLLTMLGLAYLFSTNRRAIKPKIVLWGLSLQIGSCVSGDSVDRRPELFLRAGNAVNQGARRTRLWDRNLCLENSANRTRRSDSFLRFRFCPRLFLSRRCSRCCITSA